MTKMLRGETKTSKVCCMGLRGMHGNPVNYQKEDPSSLKVIRKKSIYTILYGSMDFLKRKASSRLNQPEGFRTYSSFWQSLEQVGAVTWVVLMSTFLSEQRKGMILRSIYREREREPGF